MMKSFDELIGSASKEIKKGNCAATKQWITFNSLSTLVLNYSIH